MPSSAPMGRRLAELREHAAFTQQALADALHVTQATISLYERDMVKMPSARIAAASHAMHISVGRFFEPVGSPLPRLSFRGAEPPPGDRAVASSLIETHSLIADRQAQGIKKPPGC